MNRIKEMLSKEEMSMLVKFNNNLSVWLTKDFAQGSIERQWCITLVKHLNSLNDYYKSNSKVDAKYHIYMAKHHFENVKELYRNSNELKYKKAYGAWEILFDAYIR